MSVHGRPPNTSETTKFQKRLASKNDRPVHDGFHVEAFPGDSDTQSSPGYGLFPQRKQSIPVLLLVPSFRHFSFRNHQRSLDHCAFFLDTFNISYCPPLYVLSKNSTSRPIPAIPESRVRLFGLSSSSLALYAELLCTPFLH